MSVTQAYGIDKQNGNAMWSDAIKSKMDSLLQMGCFQFYPPGRKPSDEYHYTKLT
jgi:hypothetical protein